MASLSETETTDKANVTDPLIGLSSSKHDISEVSEGDTTFNTCLDETIRLSDLDTSTVSSNADVLDLTIPKTEAAESDNVPLPESENLELNSVKSDAILQDDLTKTGPVEDVKLERGVSEKIPDIVDMADKKNEPSATIGAANGQEVVKDGNSLIGLEVNAKIESSAESNSLLQNKETETVRPTESQTNLKNVVKSEESSPVVPIATDKSHIGNAENNSPSAEADHNETLAADSNLDESGVRDSSSKLDESVESAGWRNESLGSVPSMGDTHSESGAEETLQAAEYEREEGDGQEYESSDGEIGSSDSEGIEAPVEPIKEKKIDDDEDRRNPQYIPKRGTFYEHDDRTADDDTSTMNNADTEADRTGEQHADKKVWKEHENRWTHDGYNEEDQKPKTRQEIIDTYGYDIRNEENAPRAVRRNKYGRGPNTYTRTWEDEKAYKRPIGAAPAGGRGGNRGRDREPRSQTFYSNKVAGRNADRPQGPRKEAFPALPAGESRRDASRSISPSPREDRHQPSAWSRKEPPSSSRDEYSKYGNNLPLQLTPPPQRRDIEVVRMAAPTAAAPSTRFSQPSAENIKPFRKSTGRGVVPLASKEALPEQCLPGKGRGRDLTNKRSGSGRLGGDVRPPAETVKQSRETSQHWAKTPPTAAPKLKNQQDLANDLARMNMSPAQAQKAPAMEHHHYQGAQEYARRQPPNEPTRNSQAYQPQPQQHERRQTEVPPRLQQQESAAKDAAANRPKRYSAIQQRSLPEPGAPIPQQQQQQQQAAAYAQQHQYYQHPPNYVQPSQAPLQMLTAVHPPTTYAPTFSAAPAFIQPPGPAPPPPHLMRRPPSPGHYHPAPPHAPQAVIGYVQQGQPPPQFQPQPYPPFQAFAAVQAATSAVPPPELGLYQPQGGITYYSPAEQMRSRQQLTSERRQRAAIPIVPPPEYSRTHGRGDDAGYDQRDYGGGGDQGSYSDEDGQDDDYDDYQGGDNTAEGMSRKIKQCEG